MITSLNVNHFVGIENWMALQGNETTKINIWNEQKDYYFNYIMNHLISDDDVVILHEVPYIREVAYINNLGETKYKRVELNENKVKGEHKSHVYKELLEFCNQNNLEVLISKDNETAFIVTIAICRKNKYEVYETKFEKYKRRVVVIAKKDQPKEIIIGVHAKADRDYWNQLIKLFEETKEKNSEKKIIVIGDLNVFIPGTQQKKCFNTLLSKGLFDIWIEMGNSNLDSTYVSNGVRTRIDYALVSDNGFNAYNVFKDDSVRLLKHSDHSAIILDNI
ncbi:MAG: endonuclease/exonuclease/phosphatase family protein [Clostridiaceae bacterium]|nr:endonuclease/exonuclease/phosphatase family protein [Clostridiaceae bacterium]